GIITTNTFLTADPATIRAGVRIARTEADDAPTRILVAGSIGPTAEGGTLRQKARILADAGVDLLLLETLTSTEPIRALGAASERLPVMISATLGTDGRLPSGESLEELVAAAEECGAWSVGLNCSYGPEETARYLRRLAALTHLPLSCHPNAGMPGHTLGPAEFADPLLPLVHDGTLSILGGCCGTTPDHIKYLAEKISNQSN
ncbi:MAG: homocysteine S-methyltransferase family protein, partial [Duncaniella sp.]|nr:homocysteine S-methyltransferase family protein [Duncaniella sp.]